MQYCNRCYKLTEGTCSRCDGGGVTVVAAAALVAEAPAAPAALYATGSHKRAQGAQGNGGLSRWTLPILGIGVLLGSLSLTSSQEADLFTPEARAALPDGDRIIRQRQAEVAEVSENLMKMVAELQAARDPASPLTEAQSGRFERRLKDLQDRYHIWGTVDRQYPVARTENALNDAVLQLHSLNHATLSGAWSEVAQLEARFKASLAEANQF